MTSLAGRKVMVVEDLYYLAMDVKAALAEAGAQVVGPFPNGKAALHRLADGAPDCAILDVNLGEGASYDLARTLRSRGVRSCSSPATTRAPSRPNSPTSGGWRSPSTPLACCRPSRTACLPAH